MKLSLIDFRFDSHLKGYTIKKFVKLILGNICLQQCKAMNDYRIIINKDDRYGEPETSY